MEGGGTAPGRVVLLDNQVPSRPFRPVVCGVKCRVTWDPPGSQGWFNSSGTA